MFAIGKNEYTIEFLNNKFILKSATKTITEESNAKVLFLNTTANIYANETKKAISIRLEIILINTHVNTEIFSTVVPLNTVKIILLVASA